MERASSSRLDRRAVRYSPSSTRMRSKARARSPTSPPERTADGGRAKSPLAMALACSASSPRGRLTTLARTDPSSVASRQTTTSPSSTMASRRESIPAVVGVAGRLTSSRACSPTFEVSASVDMTTWRPASLPRRVPLVGGTRSSAVSRPIVLATGASPMARVRSASRVPLASRWSSWLSIQMPAVTVPSRQRRDAGGEHPRERRSTLTRWSIGQLRTVGSRGSSMPSGARCTPGRNPGVVWPARPSTRASGPVTARTRSVAPWRRSTARTLRASPAAMASSRAGSLARAVTASLARSTRARKAAVAERRASSSSERTCRWLERATACQP